MSIKFLPPCFSWPESGRQRNQGRFSLGGALGCISSSTEPKPQRKGVGDLQGYLVLALTLQGESEAQN